MGVAGQNADFVEEVRALLFGFDAFKWKRGGILMRFIYKGQKKVAINQFSHSHLSVSNSSNTSFSLYIDKPFLNPSRKAILITFTANSNAGAPPTLLMINRKGQTIRTIYPGGSLCFYEKASIFFRLAIQIPSGSTCELFLPHVKFTDNPRAFVDEYFSAQALLICPGYPSFDNKYLWAFIHSRMQAYTAASLHFNVAIPSTEEEISISEFEGIQVCRLPYLELRELLLRKCFRILAIHFLNDSILSVLRAAPLSRSHVYIYCHSSDLLYRDFNKLTVPYFSKTPENSPEQLTYFKQKDSWVRMLNNRPNVTFIFPSHWAKEASEAQNSIHYHNAKIIPNPIDTGIFSYHPKTEEQRKTILILRKFDNISTYGIDLNVRCILELSKKSFFQDLTFEIYGEGTYQDTLLAPLLQFNNVHIHKKYLSHQEMAEVYHKAGIALFSTRYETQGVAAAEAAACGVVVLTNDVCAVADTFDPTLLFKAEDYMSMVNKIEAYYMSPKSFLADSELFYRQIKGNQSRTLSVLEEINKFKMDLSSDCDYLAPIIPSENVLLSIIIPSYNAQRWLSHAIESIASAYYAAQIEILVINDGSRDSTLAIANEMYQRIQSNSESIIRIVNKENGGHGSAINAGLAIARGKYVKVVDADDYCDTLCLDQLIAFLKEEDSDIILTDYVEDWAAGAYYVTNHLYDFMLPGKQYQIEDLCFEGYGFNRHANILHTSTFKTSMLKSHPFKISEHCFYVDMELNMYSFLSANTIKYYPIPLYYYFLGREGQSVSPASFKKNYKQHEHVILKLLQEIHSRPVSYAKKQCLYRVLVLPMIDTQYYICMEYLKSPSAFKEFDESIKKYPEIYNHPSIAKDHIKTWRIKHCVN